MPGAHLLGSFLAATLAAPGTLERVEARGELWWGADAHGGAPYVFQDPNDPSRLIGFEVDLADAIAAKLGVRARMVQGPWDKLLDLLARGDFDLALNGLEETDDKRAFALLGRAYYAAPQRLTVLAGNDELRGLADVRGKKIGCLPGSLAEKSLDAAGAEVKRFDVQDDIYKDIVLGRTDGALADEPIARYYGDIDERLVTRAGEHGVLRYVAAFRHGDEALRAKVDRILGELAADGTLRRIYEKWGMWNASTAKLLGDPDPEPRALATGFETWRSAVGTKPSFFRRLVSRYPAMMPMFFRGALLTLAVSVLAMMLAIFLGVIIASLRSFTPAPFSTLSTVYVEVFRGTPLLVQLTLIYFGLPELGLTLSPFAAGVLALGLNYAAAESENYRAGLLSVPRGQIDAAKALGLSMPQALRHVVLPQAVRISLPPMTNDFIALLKDSSLVSVVTLTELTKVYGVLGNSTRDHLGLGFVVSAWYLLIGLPFVFLSRRLESKMGAHSQRAGAA